MKSGLQKVRLLKLMEIFEKRSDENNTFSTLELSEILRRDYGIVCERKTLYADIDALKESGMDIVCTRAPQRGYFLRTGRFSPAEIRFISDAVASAKFISSETTQRLLEKIFSLISESNAEELKSQIYVSQSRKNDSPDLFDTITLLCAAIKKNRMVTFNYSRRSLENRFLKRTEKKAFTVSPYALIWSNDHYYLVCNNPGYDNLMHVRLDRISDVRQVAKIRRPVREISPYKSKFDIADYTSKVFNMFSGEKADISLKCSMVLLDDILERFGDNVPVRSCKDGTFLVKAQAQLSEGLVKWILQYGEQIKVEKPPELISAVKASAKSILSLYGDGDEKENENA